MRTMNELLKGCGELFYCKEFNDAAKCGVDLRDGLCPTCQALLQQSKEFIEILNEIFKDDSIYTGRVIKYEIKSSIIGSEEKK